MFLLLAGLEARAQEVEESPGPGDAPAAGSTVERSVIEVEVQPSTSPCPRSESLTCPAIAVKPGYVRSSANLAETMESRPGVMVHEAGGEEGPWFLSIRGASAAGATVYLDGILISDPMGYPVDLSGAPSDLLSNVLIYRGYTPPRYPVAGTAGAVEFQMVEPSTSRAGWVRASVDVPGDPSGSDLPGGLSGSFFLADEFEGGSGVSGLSFQAGPGRFFYEDDRGTYFDSSDDRNGHRRNNDYLDNDFMLKGERKVGSSRVYAGAYHNYRRKSLPGSSGMEVDHARENRELTIGYVGVRRPGLLTPELDGEARMHFLQQRVWFMDEMGELGFARDEINTWTRVGGDFHLDYYGVPNHQLALHVSLYNDAYAPESKLDDEVESLRYSRSSTYVTLSDQLRFMDGRLRVTPSLRYVYQGNQYSGPSLSQLQGEGLNTSSFATVTADVLVTYLIADGLWFMGSAGQYYRSPALLEEYGDRTSIVGNPDLSPERSLTEQAGLLYHPGSFSVVDDLRVELTVYHHQSQHLIAWEDAGAGQLRADNVGDARATGVEVSAFLNLQDLLILEAAYAWQETEFLADDDELRGNRVPGAPQNTAYLSAIVRRSSGQVFYTMNYQDRRYLDPENRIEADPRWLHNLGVIYYRGRYSVGLSAINLGNDRGPEVLGYPLPGTRYMIFMEVKV